MEMSFKKVDPELINNLIDKYNAGADYTEDELINCYCIEDGKYITCFNEGGDCYIEEFKKYSTVVDYFTTDKDTETLYQEDN